MRKQSLGPVFIAGQAMPWGKGVVANGFVFLSGLEGCNDDDGARVEGVAAQTRLALDRGERYLREAGTSMENAVRIIQYLAHADDLTEYHDTRDQWFAAHAGDLLTNQSYGGVLLVQAFTNPDRLIEIEITAVVE